MALHSDELYDQIQFPAGARDLDTRPHFRGLPLDSSGKHYRDSRPMDCPDCGRSDGHHDHTGDHKRQHQTERLIGVPADRVDGCRECGTG